MISTPLMADRRDPRVVYQELVNSGQRPTVGIVLAALKACKASRDLKTGKEIHNDVLDRYKELSTHRFVSSSLVDLFARCGCLEDSRKVFESMTFHDLVSWNCMIQGYAQNGQVGSALELYDRMLREGCVPNRVTVLAALKACASLAEKEQCSKAEGRLVKVKSLERGRAIHLQAGEEQWDPFVANTLMDMYANCGSMEDARTVFDRMKTHDLVSWNCIILGYAQNGQGELALKLYARMQEEGCIPNTVTYLAALKACGSLCEKEGNKGKGRCLELTRSIHMQAAERPEKLQLFVSNALIDVYSKCGSMEEAYRVFKAMQRRDVVSWNSIIQGYAQSGEGNIALRLFEDMRDHGGCHPDRVTILAALKACAALTELEDNSTKLKSLEKAKAVHGQASKSGYGRDVFVASTLVDLYGKCGNVPEAQKVFDRIQDRGVVPWTSIIMAYAHNGEGEVALELYKRMQDEGCIPNKVTALAVLKACASMAENEQESLVDGKLVKARSLEKARALHLQASEAGFAADLFVGNTLVDLYAKCWSMSEASEVFWSMKVHDTVSWNCIIQGYAYIGEAEVAWDLFSRMVAGADCSPNRVTFLAALKTCATLAEKEEWKLVDGKSVKEECLKKTRAVHFQASKVSGDREEEMDAYVANSLVDVYGKCGSMADARGVFDRLKQRTTVSWSAVIMGYAENGDGRVALELYERMQGEGFSVSEVTVLAALKACVSLAEGLEGSEGAVDKAQWLEKGRALHEQAAQLGDELDVFVANSLIDMYAKCGSLVEARQVFETVKQGRRSAVTWNCLIQGYAQNDQGEVALELYSLMQASFPADKVTVLAGLKACAALGEKAQGNRKLVWLNKGRAIHDQARITSDETALQVANSLVDMYAKCGSLEDARVVFEDMKKRSVVSWNCIILAHAEGDEGKLAREFYSRMKEEGSCEPDMVTYVAVLKACASLAALEAGRRVRDEILSRSLQNEVMVANSLLSFFAKCGSMAEAEDVFRSVHDKSLVSWSALIAGYSFQGDTKRVFELFERMKSANVRPNEVTFLSVLNACSHSGMVDKGHEYFQVMVGYGLVPGIQHYTCMVDLLGRANKLEQAVALVESMPFDPDVVIWTSLLGSARKWKNLSVGELAFWKAVELDNQNSAVYVLMSNIYASLNMWKEATRIQEMRKEFLGV